MFVRENITRLCVIREKVSVGEEGKVSTTLIASPKDNIVNMCISKVALQTAQAMLVGRKSGRVRVLLDSGSQRTFVTVKLMLHETICNDDF